MLITGGRRSYLVGRAAAGCFGGAHVRSTPVSSASSSPCGTQAEWKGAAAVSTTPFSRPGTRSSWRKTCGWVGGGGGLLQCGAAEYLLGLRAVVVRAVRRAGGVEGR